MTVFYHATAIDGISFHYQNVQQSAVTPRVTVIYICEILFLVGTSYMKYHLIDATLKCFLIFSHFFENSLKAISIQL